MNLHENKELFKDAIIATSQLKGIAEIYVEKDYWITLALYSIFSDEIGKSCIFKGGTALSKCHNRKPHGNRETGVRPPFYLLFT